MDHNSLKDRENALEEEFFRRQNAETVERMRAAREQTDLHAAMAAASGISDKPLLDRLIAQGLTPASLVALALAPLVAVAWADRKLEDKERHAVLEEAGKAGLTSSTPGYEILEGWLHDAPPSSLMDTWAEYAQNLSSSMEAGDRTRFREALLGRARAVATAAGGGFAGLGSKVSDAEAAILQRVEVALAD